MNQEYNNGCFDAVRLVSLKAVWTKYGDMVWGCRWVSYMTDTNIYTDV